VDGNSEDRVAFQERSLEVVRAFVRDS
jgi:hypothetical protein